MNAPLSTLGKILLVEDEEEDIQALQRVFGSSTSLTIDAVARDGEVAIELLNRPSLFEKPLRPDIILMDLNMPRKNGFELLAEIKSDPTLRDIAVVVLTSSMSEDDIAKCLSLGALRYIRKPASISQLRELVSVVEVLWGQLR